jgi:hypothetical protein
VKVDHVALLLVLLLLQQTSFTVTTDQPFRTRMAKPNSLFANLQTTATIFAIEFHLKVVLFSSQERLWLVSDGFKSIVVHPDVVAEGGRAGVSISASAGEHFWFIIGLSNSIKVLGRFEMLQNDCFSYSKKRTVWRKSTMHLFDVHY